MPVSVGLGRNGWRELLEMVIKKMRCPGTGNKKDLKVCLEQLGMW